MADGLFTNLLGPYQEAFQTSEALRLGTLSQQLADWLTRRKAEIGLDLEGFQKLTVSPALKGAQDIVEEALRGKEKVEERYGVPFRQALSRLGEDLARAQRKLQYRFGARGTIGSGPWVEARADLIRSYMRPLIDQLYGYRRGISEWESTDVEAPLRRLALGIERGQLGLGQIPTSLMEYRRQLYSVLPQATERAYGILSDLLGRAQTEKRYEDLLRMTGAETLYGMYGTPAILSTLGTLYGLAGTPREVEEANVEAALQDLLYRLGIMSRIAGGFGQPMVRERVETTPYLGPALLSGIQTGIMSYLLSQM